MKRLRILALLLVTLSGMTATAGQGSDFFVYSIYRELDMGNPGETPQKDYYINMGSANGLREGSLVDVIRRVSTYDAVAEKIHTEVKYKIATLKIIHVEPTVAVARLNKLIPPSKMPAPVIKGVMLGDSIRLSASR